MISILTTGWFSIWAFVQTKAVEMSLSWKCLLVHLTKLGELFANFLHSSPKSSPLDVRGQFAALEPIHKLLVMDAIHT